MSPQTLERTRSLLQEVLGVLPVNMAVSNASLLPRLWLHFCLPPLRVLFRLVMVRLVQYRLSRMLLRLRFGVNTVGITIPQPEVSSLSVAPQPKILSVLAASASLAISSAVLPRGAYASHSVNATLSRAAKMGPTSTVAASPSRGSLHYFRDRLAQRDSESAKLDDKYIHREEIVTSLEARLVDMESQLSVFRSDCDALQAANNDLVKNRGTH